MGGGLGAVQERAEPGSAVGARHVYLASPAQRLYQLPPGGLQHHIFAWVQKLKL